MSSYYEAAFDAAIDDAREPQQWYVCLVRRCQAYGGPEEGGWWYTVGEVVALREYATVADAEAAAARVEALAEEYSLQAQREHGEHCLRSMEWLDQRGLDADYLPEPDGPDEYSVGVYAEVPTWNNRRPQYC
uniref:Uncharacterized protein n=1 Tax=viral metagenome TaxID=1070528 RepID=A0A6M3LX26_9ZZZZ